VLLRSLLLVLLLVLPGCQWSLLHRPAGNLDRSPEAEARADIRRSIPAIEAFYADNGTYAGSTVTGLRTTYESAVRDVRVVVTNAESYCVESDVEGRSYFMPRPHGDVRPGSCPPPAPEATTGSPAVAAQLRTMVVVMEARLAQYGSFAGVTPQWLESRIPELRPAHVVEAAAPGPIASNCRRGPYLRRARVGRRRERRPLLKAALNPVGP